MQKKKAPEMSSIEGLKAKQNMGPYIDARHIFKIPLNSFFSFYWFTFFFSLIFSLPFFFTPPSHHSFSIPSPA